MKILSNLEKKIKNNITTFDIVPLLQLLKYHGYKSKQIKYRSHMSMVSQPNLIQDINFYSDDSTRVIITLNLGLLSTMTPLPTYFFKNLEKKLLDRELFVNFIEFFDDYLIKNLLFFLYFEENPSLFPNFEKTIGRFIQLLNLKTCTTLHWIFKLVFPEFYKIKVKKVVLENEVLNENLYIGKARFSEDTILGEKKQLSTMGARITLCTDYEFTNYNKPWVFVIKERLSKMLLSVLKEAEVTIELLLVIRKQKTWAMLHNESYVGYSRIKSKYNKSRVIPIIKNGVVI